MVSQNPDALLAPLSQQVEALERLAVAKALEVTHGNKVAAAKILGVSRAKLYLRLP
jgi:DNA-binding NtrC family response regulator